MLQTSHILEMAKRLREMRMPPEKESIVDQWAEKAGEEGTDKLVKRYKEVTPGQGKEVKEATTGDKEEYQKKRRAVAKKFGVTSCSQLDDLEKKKACYAALDAAHVSDEEEDEDDDPVGKNEEVEIEEKWKKGTYTMKDGNTGKVLGKFKSGLAAQKAMNALVKKADYDNIKVEIDEEVEIEEAWVAGAVYHQEFNNGDRVYFRADSLQKNKRWKGVSVDEFGGKQKKAKNNTADEKLPNWKTTPKNEIPKGMKEEVEFNEVHMVRTQKVKDGYKWLVQKVEHNKTEIVDTGVEASRVKANIAGKKARSKITEHCGSCGEGEGIEEAKRKSKKDYVIYHKSYSGAVQHAADVAKKQGYEVDQDSWDSEITHGQRKPSEGKTVIKKIKLTKDGKPQRKMLQIQVHGMKTQYELNMYIESVGNPYSMVRRLKWGLNEGEKGVTNIKRGYLTHVKEFPPKMEAGIKKVIPGVKLAPHSITPRSESGKTIPGLGLILSGYDEPTIMIQWDERIGANPSRVPAIARGKWKSPEGDEGDDEGYDPKTHRTHTFTIWINEAASAKGSTEKGRIEWYPRQYYNEYKRVVQYLKTKVKRGVTRKEEVDIGEKIDLARSKMGDVVKDFQDSDAPQFRGKSDKKRREMAIAAKLDADRKEEYGQEDKPKSKKKDKINLKPKMDETMKTLKDIRNSQIKMDEIRWDLKDKGPEPAAELIKSAGKQLKDYALKSGGIDKKEFLATADVLLKGKVPTEKQIPQDTAPNEFVHSLLARKFGWKFVEKKYGIKFNNRKPFPEEVEIEEGPIQTKLAKSKKGKITVKDHDSLEDAKKHLADMKTKGWNGIISQDGKPVKEAVEVGEARKPARDVGLECQECGKKFRSKNPKYGTTKCPKCKSTDIDLDYSGKEEVEIKKPKVNEAVTALGVEYEEADFDGPHRLDAAYPNLNVNFAKYYEEDLEGPYEVSGEVYFYDRKVSMFYSVSGEDFVDEETGKELVYRLHKNGMYKIELGR